MTVGELIALLSHRPLDQDVVFSYNTDEDYDAVGVEKGRSVFDENKSSIHGYNLGVLNNPHRVEYFDWLNDHPKARDVTRINTR